MIWLVEHPMNGYVAFLNIEQATDYVRSLGYEWEIGDNWEPIDPLVSIWRKGEDLIRILPILFVGDIPKA